MKKLSGEFIGSTAPIPSPSDNELVTRGSLIAEMQRIAPEGQTTLDESAVESLRVLTEHLVASHGEEAKGEYKRFQAVQERGLCLDTTKLHEQLTGKTILVTGGTGCIGSALLGELSQFNPARIVSVSRGVTAPRQEAAEADYLYADIRDKEALERVFKEVKPDIIYHLAAQHDPSLAEVEVNRTLDTNVTGTHNVLSAARASGTSQIIYASTGKALRPFTPDTYAASKKVSEMLMAEAAQQGDLRCSGVRFTHVIDNSIIHHRLQKWIAADEPIRLHGSDIPFYMQSAKESAHLLLNSGLEAENGVLTMQAIRDLEWPINLVDLAVGAIAEANARTPIYFCGFETGYEERPYPGLYDPISSGGLSPLINALEAPETSPSATCPQVDKFRFEVAVDQNFTEKLRILEYVCSESAPQEVLHEAKDAVSWAMLDSRLRRVPISTLQRMINRMERVATQQQMTDEHLQTNDAIRRTITEAA